MIAGRDGQLCSLSLLCCCWRSQRLLSAASTSYPWRRKASASWVCQAAASIERESAGKLLSSMVAAAYRSCRVPIHLATSLQKLSLVYLSDRLLLLCCRTIAAHCHTVQDILNSLHETLQLDAEHLTALQGDSLIGSDSCFAHASGDSQATSPQKRFNNSGKLSCSGQLQPSGLHCTQHRRLNSTAHGKSRNLQSPKERQVQASPLQASSKSSRYLQRHLLPQLSALQQLQALSNRQNRGTDAGASSSHADSSLAFPDTLKPYLPQLHIRPAIEALQHSIGSIDQGSGAVQVQLIARALHCVQVWCFPVVAELCCLSVACHLSALSPWSMATAANNREH